MGATTLHDERIAAQVDAADRETRATGRALVTLATYNEMENLPRLVDEIFVAVPSADLLVVDDNSPDGTGRWCDEQAERDARLHCLHRAGKLGLGTATVAAMQYAIDGDYDYMVNLDADFSHPPRYLPQLIAGLCERDENGERGNRRYDVMIGSRYVAGGKIEGWPLKRHAMSRCVNLYARCLLGLGPRDCSGAFRAYRVEVLRKLDFAAIRSRGYSFQEEILWLLKRAGATFGEIPITFVERQYGQSKINSKEAYAALGVILRLGVKNWLGI
ncbi:MAG: polyprenol monophosphomannose synthase [Pirellulales bacterium]